MLKKTRSALAFGPAAASNWFEDLQKFELGAPIPDPDATRKKAEASLRNTADEAMSRVLKAYNTLLRRQLAVQLSADLNPELKAKLPEHERLFKSAFSICHEEIKRSLAAKAALPVSECVKANKF